jgi:hypothetical protein
MTLNTETTEEDITEVSKTVHHNSEVVDVVDITQQSTSQQQRGHQNAARGGYSSNQNKEGAVVAERSKPTMFTQVIDRSIEFEPRRKPVSL